MAESDPQRADDQVLPEANPADAQEQHEPAIAEAAPEYGAPARGLDVPEPDAIEQHQPAAEQAPPAYERPPLSPEVPEADAIEQHQGVLDDDDDGRR